MLPITMNYKRISIRPAVPSDVPLIGRVVTMALGDDLSLRFCGVSATDVFEAVARRTDTQYSYCNALVAELDGVAVGAIVGYDGAKLYKLRKPTLEIIKEMCGSAPNIEDETVAGEFYLDSLGVLPEYRGCGVGAALLAAARDRAFAAGFSKVGLLVDISNPRAEKLYSLLGFGRVNETLLLGHRMWHLQAVLPGCIVKW